MKINSISIILLSLLLAGCAKTDSFNFAPGFYEAGHPREDVLRESLQRSSVTVTLSGHHGISLPSRTGNGWDHDLSREQLRTRLESITDRQQATILEEKNFTGQHQLDQKVTALLKDLGFKTVVVQVCHSQCTVIKEVIRN